MRLLGDDHWSVAVAHACAAGAEHVEMAQLSVGVEGERGELQLAGEGAAVERFDIDEFVNELVRRRYRSCRWRGHGT